MQTKAQSGAARLVESADPLAGRAGPAAADVILISDLRVDAFIGILDVEKGVRQQVRFDVEIETVADYADRVRESGAFVSYADCVEYITARAATDEHVPLVETWAEDVAAVALANPLAEAVRVTVQKLDIFEAAAGVGCRITRRRVQQ